MAEKVTIVAGLDVGNGYVKGRIAVDGGDPFNIDMPATVAYTVGTNIPVDPTQEYMSDFVNALDASCVSGAIASADEGRVLFGKRAIRSGETLTEFNIANHTPKCKDSLSAQLILGSLAAAALKAYFAKTGKLPNGELDVDAGVAIALPIEDFMDYKDVYRTTLMSQNHFVHVHNFEQELCVKVTFTNVIVLPEGAAGQYAIGALGADFLDNALAIARAQGTTIDPAYTGEVLLNAKNTIGVDIGEGTVNFPVFTDGNIAVESSSSINKGYGTVLANVVAELRNTNYAFESRKSLADFMLQGTYLPAQQYAHDKAQHHIDAQVRVFTRDIIKEFSKIFSGVGLRTEAIYVYGGGANAVRDVLYPMLAEAAHLGDEQSIPVIYLDSAYSRDLNRNGLFNAAQIADAIARKKADN